MECLWDFGFCGKLAIGEIQDFVGNELFGGFGTGRKVGRGRGQAPAMMKKV